MDQYNFKIKFPKTEAMIGGGTVFIIGIFYLMMSICEEDKLWPLVIAIFMILLGATLLITELKYLIEINNNKFNVRTRIGEKYSFDCSQIKKIKFLKSMSIRYGPQYKIIITTKNERELNIHHSVKNFKLLIDYIIDKHEAKEINKSALTESTIKKFREFNERY